MNEKTFNYGKPQTTAIVAPDGSTSIAEGRRVLDETEASKEQAAKEAREGKTAKQAKIASNRQYVQKDSDVS